MQSTLEARSQGLEAFLRELFLVQFARKGLFKQRVKAGELYPLLSGLMGQLV